MAKVWQELKSEVSVHVSALKGELAKVHPAEFEDQTIQVLVKIKDNAKEALVTLAHSEKPESRTELAILLDNSKNLKSRFEKLLKDFNLKIS